MFQIQGIFFQGASGDPACVKSALPTLQHVEHEGITSPSQGAFRFGHAVLVGNCGRFAKDTKKHRRGGGFLHHYFGGVKLL